MIVEARRSALISRAAKGANPDGGCHDLCLPPREPQRALRRLRDRPTLLRQRARVGNPGNALRCDKHYDADRIFEPIEPGYLRDDRAIGINIKSRQRLLDDLRVKITIFLRERVNRGVEQILWNRQPARKGRRGKNRAIESVHECARKFHTFWSGWDRSMWQRQVQWPPFFGRASINAAGCGS